MDIILERVRKRWLRDWPDIPEEELEIRLSIVQELIDIRDELKRASCPENSVTHEGLPT